MFNPNKPVYQIGCDDGGGGGYNYSHTQLAALRRELENPPPPKYLQLELKPDDARWTIGNRSELTIDLSGCDFQPVVKPGETFTIKVLDLFIECERIRNLFAIVKITNNHGAVFNTLQVPHTHKLASMLRVTTLTPATSFYK